MKWLVMLVFYGFLSSRSISHLKVYLVGGAVRDQLLGLPVKEKDWVVVGATPEEMTARGFKPVGKEFPVFLHPETHEEYALARTERKVAKGYKGFTFYAAPDVSLEEDLKRRDLTINAIAETPEGQLIDPYGGQEDLKNKVLRHVSVAFQEDPVRVLRLARLATKFPDFSIHPDTLELMKKMVCAGEIDALVPERVWQELNRALGNEKPTRFFTVLNQCGALAILFPEIKMEGKGMAALQSVTDKTPSPLIRFATLQSDLPPEIIQKLAGRYRVPNEYADLAILVARFGSDYVNLNRMDETSLLNFLLKTDALRRQERFDQFIFTCDLISSTTSSQPKKIKEIIKAVKSVGIKPLQEKQLKGEAFAKALEKLRLEAIRTLIS
ncbi:multifunctional CCA tRNA nucleotidyl transferase/2'3'-cyclic phosphodiesterase/2'nucleotidase/phosphatase [Coxiella burnetii]|uniref:multifunctional CCA tRNA nucleotidyl transferase/2'3'-cyclic phosphodiesterase/2'nucleotidase/phosphatase n=1 Tax=Coxiella burnetii TaxID=777 RepID=UPI0009B8FE1D|nr:multifunctional CCA tRNA nucleotidyl transferase/2'3'-cyclic phosphodiesterase/2'nucleotidase/phosphatase [Coxiella burnetii]